MTCGSACTTAVITGESALSTNRVAKPRGRGALWTDSANAPGSDLGSGSGSRLSVELARHGTRACGWGVGEQ
ncbi:hypothetical protein LV79_006519 [Actinokineospora globicatena]|nr:hypothetical protein [Actinokineospora globicatena]